VSGSGQLSFDLVHVILTVRQRRVDSSEGEIGLLHECLLGSLRLLVKEDHVVDADPGLVDARLAPTNTGLLPVSADKDLQKTLPHGTEAVYRTPADLADR